MNLPSAALAIAMALPGLASADQFSDAELAQIAALRHELALFKPGKNAPPQAFCVAVKAHVGDPSPSLLAALADAYGRLVPMSDCKAQCPGQEESKLQIPRRPLFACGYISAGDVWFEPEGQANVSVRLLAGPRWGRSGAYKLRKVEGRWQVVGHELGAVN